MYLIAAREVPLNRIARYAVIESFFDEGQPPYSLDEDNQTPESCAAWGELVEDVLSGEVDGG
jgi:hypothetical protein